MEELFAFLDTSDEDILETQDVCDIIERYDILSKTRKTSKTWQDTFKVMHQLVNGTILGCRDFDKAWLARVIDKYDLYDVKFTWPELIKRTNDVLSYISERKNYGFWYPKTERISLHDFYCSTMRSGKCWSPFLELCFIDCATPMMYRKMFGDKISKKLDEIMKNVWFSIDYDTKIKFYKGVDELHDWYLELPDSFINRCDENRLVFGKFSSLLENIRQCNESTKCVMPNFINPRSGKWSVFVNWLKNKKRVEI